jgi:type III pantothenate kinase
VPAAAEIIRKFAYGRSVFELRAEVASGVDFSSYPGVATLGADRVANVLAALEYAPLPLVAIDAGTATTFDVVEKGNPMPCFAGGLIAPGLSAVAECLHAKTAQLPQCEPVGGVPIIGRNTREAMSSAIAVGYPGMVDSIVDGIETELGEPVHVLLTGGDAEWLASRMRRDVRIVPDLTLQGIAKAALLM